MKKFKSCQISKPVQIITGIIIIFVILGVFGAIFGGSKNSSSTQKTNDNSKQTQQQTQEPTRTPTPDTSRDDFKASVIFTGTQFVITNEDDLDCLAPEIKINSGLFGGGYSLKTSTFLSGETYTIEAMAITKSDGERFNPFTTAPKSIYISCGRGNDLYAASYMAELQ